MRRVRGIVLATAAMALLAPASAHAALGWHDASAGVPGSVNLESVARSGVTVIAVGTDAATGQPAIYRFDGTAWWRDTLPAGTTGRLLDVAVNADGDAWAVGAGGNGTSPLLVHLPRPPATPPVVDDPLATIPPPAEREWQVLTAGGANPLRTVSVRGAGGYAGDAGGQLWKFSAAGTVGQVALPARVDGTADARAINGVALTGDDTGFAVTDGGLTDTRIFELTSATTIEKETAVPDTAGNPVLAVATGPGGPVAIDAKGWWQPDGNGLWQRKTSGLGTSGFDLSDVSLATGVSAVSGQIGSRGYVWLGTVGNWTARKVADSPINGVAAYGSADVWAAGDSGVLARYYDKEDPPTCTADCGGGTGTTGGETGGSGTGGDSGYTYGPTTTTNGDTQTTVIQPQRKGDPTIFIVEPKQPATKNRKPRRLLDRVKVLRRAKRLIVTFRLRASARVAIAAKRGRRVVSRARSRAMRPGRRRVVLPFKGSPPNQLRIVVRPLRAKRAR